MKEQWKLIEEAPYVYVSNLGRIKRESYTILTTCGRQGKLHSLTLPSKLLGGTKLSPKGYARVNFGKRVYFVHRLIAKYWVPNPDNLPQVNHKDGNKLNNTSTNLEWVTNQQNRDHAVQTGLHARGERCATHLTEDAVRLIFRLREEGLTQKAIGIQLGIVQQTVSKILNRVNWAHLQCVPPKSGSRVFGR